MYIKKLDNGTQAECCQEGAQADDSSGQQEYESAEGIRADPVPEIRHMRFLPAPYKGNAGIGITASVWVLVQGYAKARYDDSGEYRYITL